jgi:hypothetical protein
MIDCGGGYVVPLPGHPGHSAGPPGGSKAASYSPPRDPPIILYTCGVFYQAIKMLAPGLQGVACPSAKAPAALAQVPPAPASQIAASYWRRVPLPVPHPSVPPGFAITGKPAYLVTSGSVAPARYRFATPLGPLVIYARGAYMINWGDPHDPGWAGPYPFEGEPWPNGRIVHTYDWTETATITVREQWSASWALGSYSGSLSGLVTQGVIPAFHVYQLQAIITE